MSTPGLSLARRQALADVQQRRREAAADRVASLKVPAPFTGARDFLDRLNVIATAMPAGVGRNIAAYCSVDTGTVSKWLHGTKVPTQENLAKLVAWWRANREKSQPMPVKRSGPSGAPESIALTRLAPAIAKRLQRTAKLRNLKPIRLAEQILDRHLPSADQLDKESGR